MIRAEVRQRNGRRDGILFAVRTGGGRVSVELFVITNFVMNLLVLSVGARAAGTVRWARVSAAAFVGTVYAAAAFPKYSF